ncbi:MAG: lipocalin-like domain-containing protein [Candidatus Eremiobacteraeota bacterium]|nr:lipocalin-like domain-containing protein [Candidatus Eremiobacteraeota bacterium]
MTDRTHISRKGILEVAASFGLLGALGDVSVANAAPAAGIVGAWSLVSFNAIEAQGKEKPRFGPDPVGYLMYSANARMAAVLAGTHRPALRSPAGGAQSEESRSEALRNFLSYAGRYEIRGDRVLHHVEVSVFTDLMGTTLERQFTLDGDTLKIRTLPPEIWGSANVLVWKRAAT